MSAGFASFTDGFAKGFGQTYSTIRQIQKDKEADDLAKRQKALEADISSSYQKRGSDVFEVDGKRFTDEQAARAYVDGKNMFDPKTGAVKEQAAPAQEAQPVSTAPATKSDVFKVYDEPAPVKPVDPYASISRRKFGLDDVLADAQLSAARNKLADKALAFETTRRTARKEGIADALDMWRAGAPIEQVRAAYDNAGTNMFAPDAKLSYGVDKDGKPDPSTIVMTMPDGKTVSKSIDDVERRMLGLKDRAAVKLSDAQAALAESRASGVLTPEEKLALELSKLTKKGENDKEVAKVRADASRDVATTNAGARVQAAGVTAGASERNSERSANARVEAAGIAANAPSKSAGKSDTPKMKEARLAIADLEKQYASLGRKTDEQSVKDRIAIRSKIQAWEAYRDGIRDGKPSSGSAPAAKPSQEFDYDPATGTLVPRK